MSAEHGYPIAAILADEETAGIVITELARLVARQEILVGMRDERNLHKLVERYDTTPLDRVSQATGIFSGLSQLLGTEQPVAGPALVDELMLADISEDRARYFDSELRGDRVLIVLGPNAASGEALALLARHRADLGLLNAGGKEAVIELREERLELLKSVVTEGEVVFRTEVRSEVRTFTVTLEREEFVIERRRLRSDGGPAGNVETIRIPLKHEEISIVKNTVVTEEVTVRTDQFVDTQSISETVRREVLSVEHSGNPIVHDAATASVVSGTST